MPASRAELTPAIARAPSLRAHRCADRLLRRDARAAAAPDTFGHGDGHWGELVVSTPDMQINEYARVVAPIAAGATQIAVDDSGVVQRRRPDPDLAERGAALARARQRYADRSGRAALRRSLRTRARDPGGRGQLDAGGAGRARLRGRRDAGAVRAGVHARGGRRRREPESRARSIRSTSHGRRPRLLLQRRSGD